MESCVMASVMLNYDEVVKVESNLIDSIHILKLIKILLLSPTRIIPSFQLPMISVLTKQNKKESIKEGIRKILRVKTKELKMTEVKISFEKTTNKAKSRLIIVFLNSMDCEGQVLSSDLKSEFVPILDLSKIAIGDQSMDYICAIKRWINVESVDPNGLLEWFRPQKRGDFHVFKLKRSTMEMSSDRPTYKDGGDFMFKSTSLETITRPHTISTSSPSRNHADSLDRISKNGDPPSPSFLKNVLKAKMARAKGPSNVGPISAGPMLDKYIHNTVIDNPLMWVHSDFFWQSDIVINNPFWNKQRPDESQIRTLSKSLFYKDNNFLRNRSWQNDFPLHFATFKGDILLVSPLINKGYNCTQKDRFGWTPLHYAVWYGHKEIVNVLLQSRLVSVNCTTEDSLTSLHLALINRQSTITRILLQEPDIDISIRNTEGQEASNLAETYDKQFLIPLTKFIAPKLLRVSVNLMDNTVKSLVLSHGLETTFQQLHLQMTYMLNIPDSCYHVFSFWIGFKIPKYTGKNSIIPIECFGPNSMSFKEIPILEFKLYWKRNVFLGVRMERKIKNTMVLSLLFEEAVYNFTKKSYYPCDPKDISLLSSVLLYLYLPSSDEDSRSTQSIRTLSLNRLNRPLSFILGSKANVQNKQMSASMQTLKERPRFQYKSSSFNDLSQKSSTSNQRILQAKSFLTSNKNMAMILPKKKLKNSKVNWIEEILKRFLQASHSLKINSPEEKKYRFLTLCWNLTLYGCAYFHVEVKLNSSIPFTNCILAINDMGLYFLHSATKNLIQNFKYASITWHPSEADNCLVLFTRKNNIYIKTKQSIIISKLMLKLHSINF